MKHCLAKDPLGRFQDVGELAVALSPYGSQRGQISVERCCSLLRSAGLSQQNFELISAFPVSAPELGFGPPSGLEVVPSTPTLESPMTFVPSAPAPARKWFAALGLLGLAGLVSAVVTVRGSVEPSSRTQLEGRPTTDEAAPEAAAAAPSPPSAAALLPRAVPPSIAASNTAAVKPPSAAPAAAAAARRRASPPAPKPKPAGSPRTAATVAGEPDIGF